jgi:hypothetical protein
MKKSLIFIASFLSIFLISCDKDDISSLQADDFIKYYTNYNEFSGAAVDVTSTGYALLGTAKTLDAGNQFCLLLTDKYGNIVAEPKLYGRAADDKAYCLKALNNGDFIIMGSSLNPVNGKSEGYVIYTDNNGDPVWTRVLTADGNMEVRHFETDGLGKICLTGYLDVAGDGKQILVMALNELDGSNYTNWPTFRPIGVEGDEEGSHLQIMRNGNIVITGRARNSVSGYPIYQSFIIIVNKIGQLLDWIDVTYPKEAASVKIECEATCVQIIDSINFQVLSTIKAAAGSFMSVSRVNLPSRSVLWEKSFNNVGNDDVARKFLMSGNIMYILGTTGTTSTNTAISLITSDGSGNQLSRTDFGMGTQLTSSDFLQTSDGGLIIVGTNANPGSNNSAIALIKTLDNAL